MVRPKKKIKLTWSELKQQRNSLERFELYLPTLQLKQQQLQLTIVQARQEHEKVQLAANASEKKISEYRSVLNDTAGINIIALSEPEDVKTTIKNIAGIKVPVFESATFPEVTYSLFGTPPWVDQALADLSEKNRHLAELEILERKLDLLQAELKKVMQRVNLFEKVIIPETQKNIRRIRIALGDQMTAAVARAKIAKAKLEKREHEGIPGAISA
jgi:V/A-type H+/Na+-transporting ATPase subunit D